MKMKINLEQCTRKIKNLEVSLEMSEQSMYDLAVQKNTLVSIQSRLKDDEEFEMIDGLLSLLDSIQNQAVEKGIFREEVVFPYTVEE